MIPTPANPIPSPAHLGAGRDVVIAGELRGAHPAAVVHDHQQSSRVGATDGGCERRRSRARWRPPRRGSSPPARPVGVAQVFEQVQKVDAGFTHAGIITALRAPCPAGAGIVRTGRDGETQFIGQVGVCGLRIAPQFDELAAHVRMERLSECLRKPKGADRLEHVGEILQAVGCGHAGGELQFEQCGREARVRNRSPSEGNAAGSGNAIGFGLPSPGNSPATRMSIGTSFSVSRSSFATLEEFERTPGQGAQS